VKLSTDSFRSVLAQFPTTSRYLIAYSGGLDSSVLLDLCAGLRARESFPRLTAVHVNHGLHEEAGQWVSHCVEVCCSLHVPCQVLQVDAGPKPDESPEEAARRARYEALRQVVGEGEILLTAQHRDDQAETILLQLFRGAGLAGLSGMGAVAPFGKGLLVRPFLDCSRQSLQQYAAAHRLRWIEDSSNEEIAYDRNFLRHEVMPVLKKRWSGIAKTVQRSGRHCAEAQMLLTRAARDLYASTKHSRRNTLLISKLLSYDEATRRLIIREWIRTHGKRSPSATVMCRIVTEAVSAGEDKSPRVCWKEGEIRRFRNELYCFSEMEPFDPHADYDWDGHGRLMLPGSGRLESFRSTGQGIAARLWNSGRITVRFRTGGERCRLPGRRGRHTLKKLFQEQAVPPWVRERMPLVYIDDELAAVGDLRVCEPFQGGPTEQCVGLRWCTVGLGWAAWMTIRNNGCDKKR
jgi:tRNA(Ile)-lysidine synthase